MKSRASTVSLLVLVVGACGGQATPPPDTRPAASAPATTTTLAPAASGAEFGVPECDNYINKYLACVDSKVPEAARAMMREQLEQTRQHWRDAASNAEGRSALAVGCKAAADGARTAMASYGCTF
jgi:hypothetical protein